MKYLCRFLIKNGNGLSERRKNKLIKEFMAKREMLVDLLNPRYETWNAEFDLLNPDEVSENDPMKDYGGTAYCKFITDKQRTYANIVNAKNPKKVQIKIDDTGDIYGEKDGVEISLYLKEM